MLRAKKGEKTRFFFEIFVLLFFIGEFLNFCEIPQHVRVQENNATKVGLFAEKFSTSAKKKKMENDKMRTKRKKNNSRRTMYLPRLVFPPGFLPGGHTRRSSGIPCLRGADVGLQSLLSGADKCLWCTLRASLEVLFAQNTRQKQPLIFAAKVENFSGEKTHSLSRKQPNHYFLRRDTSQYGLKSLICGWRFRQNVANLKHAVVETYIQ